MVERVPHDLPRRGEIAVYGRGQRQPLHGLHPADAVTAPQEQPRGLTRETAELGRVDPLPWAEERMRHDDPAEPDRVVRGLVAFAAPGQEIVPGRCVLAHCRGEGQAEQRLALGGRVTEGGRDTPALL